MGARILQGDLGERLWGKQHGIRADGERAGAPGGGRPGAAGAPAAGARGGAQSPADSQPFVQPPAYGLGHDGWAPAGAGASPRRPDRESVGEGTRGPVSVDLGGRRTTKKKNTH